jgi:hypothetical protein
MKAFRQKILVQRSIASKVLFMLESIGKGFSYIKMSEKEIHLSVYINENSECLF